MLFLSRSFEKFILLPNNFKSSFSGTSKESHNKSYSVGYYDPTNSFDISCLLLKLVSFDTEEVNFFYVELLEGSNVFELLVI